MERSTAMDPWKGNTATVTTVSVSMAMDYRDMEAEDVGVEKDTEMCVGVALKYY